MQQNHIGSVEMKKIVLLKKKTLWSSKLGIKTEKSNYNARKRMGSTSTLKLTKFYKLRDGCSLGLYNKNY